MKKILSAYISIVALLLNCQTVIEVDIPVDAPQFVINSSLIEDEFIMVNLSQSQGILDSDPYEYISDAFVEIYEDGLLLTILPDSTMGNYISDFHKPKRGKTYQVKVSKTGFETASGEVMLPSDTVDILSVKRDTVVINDYGYISSKLRFSVEIQDNKDIDNYYEISVVEGFWVYTDEFDYITGRLVKDSSYVYNNRMIESYDPSLEYYQSYGKSILFNDEFFNGNTYQMNVLSEINYISTAQRSKGTIYVVVNNTSKSHYLYGLSYLLQHWNEGDPFAQPVQVYNNISNGFGVLSAYNRAVFKVEK